VNLELNLPTPRLIRTDRDAEEVVAEWMTWMGFQDARVTPVGPDCGVDVESHDAVAQVKARKARIGRPDLQGLYGEAMKRGKRPLFFSLGGYTSKAIEWAEWVGMPLFAFDHQGEPVPASPDAEAVMAEATARASRELRSGSTEHGVTLLDTSAVRHCKPVASRAILVIGALVARGRADIYRDPVSLAAVLGVSRTWLRDWLKPGGKIADFVHADLASPAWDGESGAQRWNIDMAPAQGLSEGPLYVKVPDYWWRETPSSQSGDLYRLRSDVTPGALWVACLLASEQDDQGTRRSASQWAKASGCSLATFFERLRQAEDAGLIAVSDRAGGRPALRKSITTPVDN
jgi:hypothetical protein